MVLASMIDYDAELQRHHEYLRRGYGIRRSDQVLDIGCGAGLTTRDAGRLAPAGSALGIDISEAMIAEARSRASAEGASNLAFVVGDAQLHPLGDSRFDVAISRFGTMFFADPIAAFSNIGRSLRPGGRLVMLVWQAYHRNVWAVLIDQALDDGSAARPSSADAPFSLGDPGAVERVLGHAGFEDAALVDVRAPVYYGPDPDAALLFVSGFADVERRLRAAQPDAGRVRERLRSLMEAHDTGSGVWFDACSWLVTARRV
jgi:SAM-dependent methyltransferase